MNQRHSLYATGIEVRPKSQTWLCGFVSLNTGVGAVDVYRVAWWVESVLGLGACSRLDCPR